MLSKGKVLFAIVLCYLGFSVARAQQSPLIIVGPDSISAGEFLYSYNKNRNTALEKDSLSMRKFLKSYIDFRLKVADAKSKGLDKRPSFLSEYRQYQDYLLVQFLLDSAEREQIYKDAYFRMQLEMDASHILIKVTDEVPDSVAHAKAQMIRQRLLDGESFEELAVESSDDPSVKQNKGRIGFFSAFTLVYPFEVATYKLSKGEISQPVRTRFGYHIIRLNDMRKSRGQVRVAHIIKRLPANPTPKELRSAYDTMNRIHQRLEAGEDFGEMAKRYSEDGATREFGGVLPWVTTGKFPKDFEDIVYSLKKDGDLSPVARTSYGLHIVKKLDHRLLDSYNATRSFIRANLIRAGILLEGKDALRRPLAAISDTKIKKDILDHLAKDHLSDLGHGRLPEKYRAMPFATVAGRSITLGQLDEKLQLRSDTTQVVTEKELLDAADDLIERAQDQVGVAMLCQSKPDQCYLLHEFRDGLLLFAISDETIWNNPNVDKKILKKIYKTNKGSYRFSHRVRVEEYYSADSLTLANFSKTLCESQRRRVSKKSLKAQNIRYRLFSYERDVPLLNGYTTSPFANPVKSPDEISVRWNGFCSDIVEREAGYAFYRVKSEKRNVKKNFREAQGQLMSAYYDIAQKRWLDRLRQRIPVSVDEAQFKRLESQGQ